MRRTLVTTPPGPREALTALNEIGARRQQVVDVATGIPNWYWLFVGLPMIALAVAVDSRNRLAIGIGAAGFVLVVLAATAAVVIPSYRRAQWHRELLGTQGPVAIIVFVGTVVGGTLALAFGLQALEVAHPATIACIVGGAAVIVGGPLLMRRLRRIMLEGS
jgi:hypothetical protein